MAQKQADYETIMMDSKELYSEKTIHLNVTSVKLETKN